MKILYLITKSEAGGAQTYVYQLAKYFSEHNQVAIMSDGKGWLYEQSKKLRVNFYKNEYFSNSINPISVIKAMIKINKIVKEFNPDLIHCNSSTASFLGRLVVHNRVPTIFTAHGWGFNIGVPWWQKQLAIFGEKLASHYCSVVICVSNFVKELAIKYKITDTNKLTVIYNGVEIREKSTDIDDKKIRLVFAGRLAEPKRPMLLLRAINNLPDNIKDKFEVSIIGDGQKRKELECYISDNKINNVKLLGQLPRDGVLDALAKSDVLVFLSKYEGFPYVILEAMSFGLPVISSNVGGIKEIVNDSCGFLLNHDDDLVEIFKRLANEKNIIIEKGKKSKDKIINSFSIDQMLKSIDKEYKKLL